MVGPLRIRSSIACARCRRSKIKCENTGRLDSPCENCVKSGNRCIWPVAAPLPSKKPEPPAAPATRRHVDEPNTPAASDARRKRPKRREANAASDDTLYDYDVLVVRRIDRALWDNILLTYQRHFATELPFLHIPTLKNKIYDLTTDQNSVAFDTHLVLLGLLALTARYHPELASYTQQHDPLVDVQEPQDLSGAFARTLDKALGSFVAATSIGSVERVQTLLMLGLYEWISPSHEGLRAWMLIGAAGRMAQALKLGYEAKSGVSSHRAAVSESVVIDREVRRRTMYSCFIFDRLISCGKERPSFIVSEDLQIQLPCSKEDFDFGRSANTGHLVRELSTTTTNPDVSILGRLMQLVDIWGRVSHYTNVGGRFSEKSLPPWSERSVFFRLRRDLDDFAEVLETPGSFLGLSASNYFRHESTSGTYILLHLLMALCRMMVHRQYLPFIPIKCAKPSGPLDEPTFPPHTVPPGFWEESAREHFKASKTVVDLVQLCEDRLPHSPLVAFVIYTASFIGIYARYFPHMDREGHLTSLTNTQAERGAETVPVSASVGATKVLHEALSKLARYSGVASAFVSRFDEADQYFFSMVQDYHRNLRRRTASQQSGNERLSVRLGGDTGGLEEWVVKSDRMVSNSFIMKENENHAHDAVGAVREPEDGEGIGRGGVGDGGLLQGDTTSSRPSPPRETVQMLESTEHSGLSHSHARGMAFVGETPVVGGHHIQSPPLSSSVPSHITSGDGMLMENGDDWSWAFLNDMYLGSVSLDPAESGPSYPF